MPLVQAEDHVNKEEPIIKVKRLKKCANPEKCNYEYQVRNLLIRNFLKKYLV